MKTTLDAICRGELILEQPRRGYRFNVDSVILASFVTGVVDPIPHEVVDLGAGCGIVGLLLAGRWPGCRVTLVEIQPPLAELARSNASRNRLDHRAQVHCADLRRPHQWGAGSPSLIVSNPPFFKAGSGRASASREVGLARHEITCTLEELLSACNQVLAPGGQVALIHIAARCEEIIDLMKRHRLGRRHQRMVRPLPDRPFTRVLMLAEAGADDDPREHAPLLVEERPGVYSAEMESILGAKEPASAPQR